MDQETQLWNEDQNLRSEILQANHLNDQIKDSPDKKLRPFGLCAGEFTVPDNFDDPLPEEILKGFEGR